MLKTSLTWERKQSQVQEAYRVPYRTNPKRNISRDTVNKMTKNKDKERILKAARKKQQNYIQGNFHEDAR